MYIDDSKVRLRIGKRMQTEVAYGGYYAKVLANFLAHGKCSLYAQRNDTSSGVPIPL